MRKYKTPEELVDALYRWADSPYLAIRLRASAAMLEDVDKFSADLNMEAAKNLEGMYAEMHEMASMLCDPTIKKPPSKSGAEQ